MNLILITFLPVELVIFLNKGGLKMKKVFSEAEGKLVEVRNLKNLTFKSHPGCTFFVHRTLGSSKTFTVTENSTGVAARLNCDTIDIAIAQTEFTLANLKPDSSGSVGSLKSAVEQAQKRILGINPDITFPVNR
jgi:hypothetical protein